MRRDMNEPFQIFLLAGASCCFSHAVAMSINSPLLPWITLKKQLVRPRFSFLWPRKEFWLDCELPHCGCSYSRVDVSQSSTAGTNAICTSKVKEGQTYGSVCLKLQVFVLTWASYLVGYVYSMWNTLNFSHFFCLCSWPNWECSLDLTLLCCF